MRFNIGCNNCADNINTVVVVVEIIITFYVHFPLFLVDKISHAKGSFL